MELLDGEELEDLLRREKKLDLERFLEIFEPVCAAVEAAHDKHIVHRDMKPSNVFLDRSTGSEVVKVLDKYQEKSELLDKSLGELVLPIMERVRQLIREREDGEYLFEIRRDDRDEIRDIEAELLVITGLGTDDAQVSRVPVTLSRETEKRRFRLEGAAVTEVPAT